MCWAPLGDRPTNRDLAAKTDVPDNDGTVVKQRLVGTRELEPHSVFSWLPDDAPAIQYI